MRIEKRFAPFVFASIMAVAMGLVMSFFLTWINTGLADGFLCRWTNAFGISVLVAFPTSLAIAPLAQKAVGTLVEGK